MKMLTGHSHERQTCAGVKSASLINTIMHLSKEIFYLIATYTKAPIRLKPTKETKQFKGKYDVLCFKHYFKTFSFKCQTKQFLEH